MISSFLKKLEQCLSLLAWYLLVGLFQKLHALQFQTWFCSDVVLNSNVSFVNLPNEISSKAYIIMGFCFQTLFRCYTVSECVVQFWWHTMHYFRHCEMISHKLSLELAAAHIFDRNIMNFWSLASTCWAAAAGMMMMVTTSVASFLRRGLHHPHHPISPPIWKKIGKRKLDKVLRWQNSHQRFVN